MPTGFLSHELYMWHDTGSAALWFPSGTRVQPGEHAENAETKRRFRNLLEVAGMLDHLVVLKPREATADELARVHTADYVARIRLLSEGDGGDAGEVTPFGHGGFRIACLSAGGVITALDAVLDGAVGNAYALVRPPGHHAERDRGRGFCIFANIAVAIRHAQATHGLGRVAVVDWDVHHGNGTQQAFWEDPSVLTISIHQDNWYPADSGRLHETGGGPGEGYNINVPLPPGSGREPYLAVLERVVVPALRAFRPEAIVVACGFDGSIYDPLGRMLLTSTVYRSMTETMMALADELCGGRLLLAHEGGYSAAYVPYCGLAVLEALSGVKSPIDDVFAATVDAAGGHQLYRHQETVIDAAAELAAALAHR